MHGNVDWFFIVVSSIAALVAFLLSDFGDQKIKQFPKLPALLRCALDVISLVLCMFIVAAWTGGAYNPLWAWVVFGLAALFILIGMAVAVWARTFAWLDIAKDY